MSPALVLSSGTRFRPAPSEYSSITVGLLSLAVVLVMKQLSSVFHCIGFALQFGNNLFPSLPLLISEVPQVPKGARQLESCGGGP